MLFLQWFAVAFLYSLPNLCTEVMLGFVSVRASPAARRISDAEIVRSRPFASPGGRQNDREGRNVRLRRGLPRAAQRILDMQMFFLVLLLFNFVQ
jgi:hypothetical protein